MKIDWELYKKQADAYLARDVFSGTPLTGYVLAESAKKTYEETGKYIPVEFALAQAQRESSMGRKGRSPKNNPYNVGEFDEGTKIKFNNTQEGVQAYFDLIANDYLVDGKTTDDLMKNYVNKNGSRYASDKEYESYFQQQVPYIQKYLKKQTGFDLSSLNPFSATDAYGAEIPNQENSMPQTAQDPRESLTLLQRLLTSPQAEAMFSAITGENKKKSPYEEGVNKALKQLGEQQAIEAAQSGVPIKQIEQQTQQMTGNTFTLPPEGLALLQQSLPKKQQEQQQPVQQKPQGYDLLRNIIQSPEQNTSAQQQVQANDLSAALAGQSNQTKDQEPPQGKNILDKLYERFQVGMEAGRGATDPNYVTRQLQKQELEQGGKLGEQKRKMQSDFLLEDYKQNRLDQREELKSKLENGGFGSGASMLGAEISDFISAWDDVSLKGRVGGLAGAVGGFLGFQRGERAAFESFGSSLSWKFGEHILGQKGRAFTENERKDVEKRIIGASLSKSYSEMKAKMNAIIKMANARIPEGSEKIPDFDTILKGMKSQKKGGKNSSDVQSELEAINKRLQELGG